MEINLKDIHSPADIKGMDFEHLHLLSGELRAALMRKLAAEQMQMFEIHPLDISRRVDVFEIYFHI